MDQPTFYTLPVLIAVAIISGAVTLLIAVLGWIYLFPKTRAETKNQNAAAGLAGAQTAKAEAETEAAELLNEEKRNLLSNNQISALLKTALDQSGQIDTLLKETGLQKQEIARLVDLVNFGEQEKTEMRAVIKYQQTEMERMQKSWAETIVKLNESRQRENVLSDQVELSVRQANRFEKMLVEAGIVANAPTGALPPLRAPVDPLPEGNNGDSNDEFKTRS